MKVSKADYAIQYDACEKEEMRLTGEVQAGFDVFAVDQNGGVSVSPGLSAYATDFFEKIQNAPVVSRFGYKFERLDASQDGIWVRHIHSGTAVYERAVDQQPSDLPSEPDWDALMSRSNGNLWKLASNVCSTIRKAVGCQRAMVYRFHEDWSGEVIAESVAEDLDPYLGLFYPPTDIPRQARNIFLETGTRHIFSTHRSNQPLVSLDGTAAPVDLTHAMSRSVSPYHLEYLRNMGTASTASCALIEDGKLWGLVSLHYVNDRAPNIAEVAFLQGFVCGFQAILKDTLQNERNLLKARGEKIIAKQRDMLIQDGDAIRTLLLSGTALHRLVGGEGGSVVVGDHICCVGAVPATDAIVHICSVLGKDLAPMQTLYLDELPDSIRAPGCGDVAGVAITRISAASDAFLIAFRNCVSQSVTWGGDPRRSAQPSPTYSPSPRSSFAQWVEEVEGKALPWTELQKDTMAACLTMTLDHFEASPDEFAILLRNSIRIAVRQPDRIRQKATETIESIRTAMAFGIERRTGRAPKIMALNAPASDAFSLTLAEVLDMPLADLASFVGVDLSDLDEVPLVIGVATAHNGLRDCYANTTLLFEYANLADAENGFRIEATELDDVTEKRRIEAALVAARDTAMREVSLREEFFAKLNHELRTPLNVMIGLSSLMLGPDAAGLPEKTFKRLEVIKQASEHLSQIVEMGLQGSSALQGMNDAHFAACSATDLVAQVFDLLRLQADKDNIDLIIHAAEDLMVYVEPRAARQLLINIIANAIKYNVPKGHVSVSLSRHTADFVRIEIADTGIGMTQAQVDQCMKPYQRFANGEGSGLGLSIAQHLVSSLGGLLTIQSEHQVGSRITLLLPPPKEGSKTLRTLPLPGGTNPVQMH